MAASSKPRVLIIGCTGYIGRFITNASIRLGYPTYLLVRPEVASDVYKAAMGSVTDEKKLVEALKLVDIVICSIAEKNLNDQRFLPSEFGMDPGLMDHAIAPGNKVFMDKMKIRRAIEAAQIPHTYVSANCFAGYFLSGIAQFGRFFPPRDTAVVYGEGNAKVIWVDENDVGTFVLKAAEDPRTLNTSVYIRPPKNILSLNEVLQLWEKKIGKTLEKQTLLEEEFMSMISNGKREAIPIQNSSFISSTLCIHAEKASLPERAALAHFYQIFYRGDLMFEIGPDGRDTGELYPDVSYTTVDAYLDRYL
ncbi:bifunctional pinoresinol-lariciresinol reductase 2 [Selaginella moellendorffii]|uniref:bifunctional pinoresinol-lariciresinol reductase 2 n=1 Tax=Selaginella moellendorffii TaxID=88036 RepID=UPI000D1C5124|nr:bifunctional pinoresinol-lariciresinol reductase 2 [Selaginella moellendorffii]|eukprot:XP_024538712.1 bifunctional pinoresinol-lariciresinol reductase 2 [Selaginella moellendorffii]